jgi:hypothetical protein
MLTKNERNELEETLLSENKKVMKEMLHLAELGLPTEKFERFRHSVLNAFGKSGLSTKVHEVLDKYESKD